MSAPAARALIEVAGLWVSFGTHVVLDDLALELRGAKVVGVGGANGAGGLYEELPVNAQLLLHARMFGVPDAAAKTRVAALCEELELTDVLERTPRTFSSGMRRRLALARWSCLTTARCSTAPATRFTAWRRAGCSVSSAAPAGCGSSATNQTS